MGGGQSQVKERQARVGTEVGPGWEESLGAAALGLRGWHNDMGGSQRRRRSPGGPKAAAAHPTHFLPYLNGVSSAPSSLFDLETEREREHAGQPPPDLALSRAQEEATADLRLPFPAWLPEETEA